VKGQIEEFKKELLSVAYTLLTLMIVKYYPRPIYGYKIIQLVNTLSSGKIVFKEGTLYPVLKKLQKIKLLDSFWGLSESGPPRKYYTITNLGEASLKELIVMWDNMVSAINSIREKAERGELG